MRSTVCQVLSVSRRLLRLSAARSTCLASGARPRGLALGGLSIVRTDGGGRILSETSALQQILLEGGLAGRARCERARPAHENSATLTIPSASQRHRGAAAGDGGGVPAVRRRRRHDLAAQSEHHRWCSMQQTLAAKWCHDRAGTTPARPGLPAERPPPEEVRQPQGWHPPRIRAEPGFSRFDPVTPPDPLDLHRHNGRAVLNI